MTAEIASVAEFIPLQRDSLAMTVIASVPMSIGARGNLTTLKILSNYEEQAD
jgi:hypothetical protein